MMLGQKRCYEVRMQRLDSGLNCMIQISASSYGEAADTAKDIWCRKDGIEPLMVFVIRVDACREEQNLT
jgi:hypothetical protein